MLLSLAIRMLARPGVSSGAVVPRDSRAREMGSCGVGAAAGSGAVDERVAAAVAGTDGAGEMAEVGTAAGKDSTADACDECGGGGGEACVASQRPNAGRSPEGSISWNRSQLDIKGIMDIELRFRPSYNKIVSLLLNI